MAGVPYSFPWRSYKVTIRLDEVGGKIAVIGFDVSGKTDIEATTIRAIPFREFVQQARWKHFKRLQRMAKSGAYLGTDETVSPALRRRAARQARLTAASGVPLEQAARVYSEALDRGMPPTKVVAETFGVSRTAAAKWIARAREKGLLPRTVRGRAKARRKGGRR